MVRWHRTRRGDLELRAAGAAALALACAAIVRVLHLHDADPQHWAPGLLGYGLIAIGFCGACAGSAMAMMGRHLFDEVEISERWRTAPPPHDARRRRRSRAELGSAEPDLDPGAVDMANFPHRPAASLPLHRRRVPEARLYDGAPDGRSSRSAEPRLRIVRRA